MHDVRCYFNKQSSSAALQTISAANLLDLIKSERLPIVGHKRLNITYVTPQ